jgi:hypothetical protein
MKPLYLFFSVVTLTAFSASDKSRKLFNIDIYYESNINAGIRIHLNQDRIRIVECSGIWGCNDGKVSYKKELTKQQSDTIYRTMRSLKLDTLKGPYNFQNTYEMSVFDGTYAHYTFSGDGIRLTRTTSYAMTTPAIDSLENLINRMIVPETYWKKNLMFH